MWHFLATRLSDESGKEVETQFAVRAVLFNQLFGVCLTIILMKPMEQDLEDTVLLSRHEQRNSLHS